MNEQGKVLVTGATGKVGREVVTGLLERGVDFRALARDPDNANLPDGVEVVRGDLTNPDALENALESVGVVFLLWAADDSYAPAAVEEISRHANRIVYLSSEGVRDDLDEGSDQITSSHANMERLIEASGLEWTFLRPTGFASNTLGWAEDIRTDGVARAPFGEARRPLIHERDIAAVAVHALTEEDHKGKKYILTGPESLAQSEQARLIGEAIGRPVRWEETSRDDAREGLIAAFGDASAADGVLNAWEGFITNPEPVTDTVEEITGKKALTFRKWAEDHADDFR